MKSMPCFSKSPHRLLAVLAAPVLTAVLPFYAAAQPQTVTGPNDPNADFHNPAGTYVLAEYYGGWNAGPLTIGAATLVQNSPRVSNTEGTEQNTPNFGSSSEQKAFAYFSDSAKYQSSGGLQTFAIPVVPGRSYKEQFFYHDNNYNATGKRKFAVTNNGVVLTASMDLVALGAYTTNAVDVVLTSTFVAASNSVTYEAARAVGGADNALISALTLEDTSPDPYIYTQPASQAVNDGTTVQLSVFAAGTNLVYQWQSSPSGAGTFTPLTDGVNVSGSATAALTLRNMALANTDYQVVITNSSGSVTSSIATVTATTSAPQITGDIYPAPTAVAGYAYTFSVSVTGSGPITYQWTHNGSPLSDGGRISGAHSNILTVAAVQASDAGSYQLTANNTYGSSNSTVAALTVTNTVGIYDGSTWTLNGGAVITNNVLTLTDGGFWEGRTAFFNAYKVNVDSFTASFVYQDLTGAGADGIALVFQNSVLGPGALGSAGGAIGYGAPGTIGPSAEVVLGIYNNEGTSVRTGGSTGGYTALPSPMTGMLSSGDPILVTLNYWAQDQELRMTLTDTVTGETFPTYYIVDLPTALGYPGVTGGGPVHTAYVGFAGGSGGLAAIQTISDFTFTNTAPSGSPLVITNWNDPLLDLQGNALGHFVLAEYYGGTNAGTLQLGNAAFVQNNARVPGNIDVDQNRPNFGASPQQQALSRICDAVIWNAGGFTVPTVPGHTYKLQLLFHENYWGGRLNRSYDVIVNGATNAPRMDLVALGSSRTSLRVTVVTNIFTATGNSASVAFQAYNDNPIINALTLADLTLTPGFVIQPINETVYNGDTAQFSVVAGGEGPISYQWQARANGTSDPFTNVISGGTISGATSATLALNNVPLANVDYQVVLANAYGSITSTVATLTVITGAPQIAADIHPLSLQQPAGYALPFSVAVIGSKPMSYQWKFNGSPLSDGGRVSGAHSNVLTIANAQLSDAGSYQLFVTNAYGNASSSSASVTILPYLTFGDGSAWTTNGGAVFPSPDLLTLTDGSPWEGRSVFFEDPVSVDAFTAQFTYQDASGGGADGIVFIFQNDPRGTAALGNAGGDLGYGTAPAPAAIVNSVGLQLDIYFQGMALHTNGATGGYASTSPVNLNSGNPINVTVQYVSGTMSVTLVDPGASATNVTTYNINIANAVGGNTAYMGFSGGSGAFGAIQQVSNFKYTPISVGSPLLVTDVHPLSLTQPLGLGFSLSAAVAGTAPLSYQWKFNGAPLANNSRISGATSNTLAVAYALTNDIGNYQLFISNFYGSTNTSVATVTVSNAIGIYDGSAWALNGSASVPSSGTLGLTHGAFQEASSVFLDSPVYIDAFIASFTFQDVSGNTINPADGAAFILQNSPAGASALGSAAGGLGYAGITPSASVQFNLYSGNGVGMAFNTNGLVPVNGGNPNVATDPVLLTSGDPITVTIYYAASVMTVILTDATTAASYTTTYSANLPTIMGGHTAYVGFSGASGALTSQEQIRDFTFVSIPTLSVQQTGGNTVVSWPVAEGPFVLEENSNLATTNWVPSSGVTAVNGRYQLTVPQPGQNKFYRLVYQP